MIHLKFVNVHVLFPVWCYGIKPTLNNIFIEFYNIITRGKQEIKEIKVLKYQRQKCGPEAVERCFSLGSVLFFPSTTRKAYTKPHWAGSCYKDEKSLGSRCSRQKKCFSWCRLGLLRYFIGHWFPTSELFTDQCFFFFTPHLLKQGHSQNTGDKCYLFSATYLISSYS